MTLPEEAGPPATKLPEGERPATTLPEGERAAMLEGEAGPRAMLAGEAGPRAMLEGEAGPRAMLAGVAGPLAAALVGEDEPPPATWKGRLIAAAVPLVLGAAALVNSILLGLGSLTDPGAGLWPAGASCLMIVGSVLLFVRRHEIKDGEAFSGAGLRTIGVALILTGVFVILFGGMGSWPGTGFEWATALMLALWLKLIGRESWLMTAAVSVGVTAGLHLLFIELLKAPIPHTIG